MLSETGCRDRRNRLWASLPQEIDWVVVADPRHVNYLSGFSINPISASWGEHAFLFLKRGGETVLICDSAANGAAIGKPHVDQMIIEAWYGATSTFLSRGDVLFNAVRRICGKYPARSGLVEEEWLPAGTLKGFEGLLTTPKSEALSLSSVLRKLRRKKDPDELEILKRCFRAGEAGHKRAREVVAPGVRELDVYREVQSAATDAMGTPVVVYGEFRASTQDEINIVGLPKEYKLQRGDTLILDFSVIWAGYRGDFTNTIAVGGANEGQRRLMDLCRAGMAAGEKALRPGATGSEVFHAVDAAPAAAGHPLQHHAGHGLGMEHPEAPAFIAESEDRLQSGEVVTLEPGVYVEGVGGVRIEHNYLITETGPEQLTHQVLGL